MSVLEVRERERLRGRGDAAKSSAYSARPPDSPDLLILVQSFPRPGLAFSLSLISTAEMKYAELRSELRDKGIQSLLHLSNISRERGWI